MKKEKSNLFNWGNLKIAYYQEGRGKRLVMIHGLASTSYTWRYLTKALGNHYEVITLDLKGFGQSDKPMDSHYSMKDQGEIIAEFIIHKGIKDACLIGHSMGGGVCLFTYLKLLSISEESRINSLIFIDAAIYPQRLPLSLKIARISIVNRLLFNPLTISYPILYLVNRIYFRFLFYKPIKPIEEMTETVKEYAKQLSIKGSHHSLRKSVEQLIPDDIEDVTKSYQDIKMPVLLLWGEKDRLIPSSTCQKLIKDIPQAVIKIVPFCGHVPQEEKPRETVHIIENFLKSIER